MNGPALSEKSLEDVLVQIDQISIDREDAMSIRPSCNRLMVQPEVLERLIVSAKKQLETTTGKKAKRLRSWISFLSGDDQ